MSKILGILQPIALISVPVVLIVCALLGTDQNALLTLFVVVAALIPFFAQFELRRPRPRDIMPIVVLSAIAIAGRLLFAALPNFKPVTAIVILGALCFGKQSGFLIGALSALASNIFFGQGAWSPWQMYAWGMIGYVAGSLSNTRLMQHNIGVYIYGCIASLCFGLLMDTWTLIAFVHPITWPAALLNYSAGISFNLIHAVSTLVFLLVLLRPWRKKLERIRTKFGILDFPSQADDVSTLK